jgi:O-acetyl-ADP-ribose deacetylase (regulator of RNase III)
VTASFSLPPITITILEGDITARPVDAIVNAANNAFWMGSGVAGAIKAKGGAEIEREAMAQGPVTPGQAVLTSGGSLAAGHVIHAAVMGQDLRTDAALIHQATLSSLALAAAHQLSSIAFPALGTGVGGFPVSECARVMVEAVREHASGPTSIRLVEFVLFGARAYDEFGVGARAVVEPGRDDSIKGKPGAPS